MSFVLGITGGIGSGKTAVTNHLATKGIEIIDADIIAREVVAKATPALKTISEHFGSSILLHNGELDRSQLRTIIFNSPKEKLWLENLLHPIIRQSIKDRITSSSSLYCVLVAPLLLEGDLHTITNKIVVVDCRETTQIKRASGRDNTDESTIRKIMSQQMSRDEKLKKADIIIDNEGTINELTQQIDQLHQQLLQELA